MNYTRIYNQLMDKAQFRIIDEYTEWHHIIPRCIGGSDDGDNLVALTPKEHYVAHRLLTKMYPDNKSLDIAFAMMCYTRDIFIPSRVYAEAREKHSMWMSTREVTEETRAKMSKSAKERCTPEWRKRQSQTASRRTGEKNSFYGKTHSDETKAKISKANKGRLAGEKNPFYGKDHTPEFKAKMSALHRGKTISEEQKNKQRNKMNKKKWYNNGEKSVRAEACPEGFVPGRLTFKRRRKC